MPATTKGSTLALCEEHQRRLQVCENIWIGRMPGVNIVDRRIMKNVREEVVIKAHLYLANEMGWSRWTHGQNEIR